MGLEAKHVALRLLLACICLWLLLCRCRLGLLLLLLLHSSTSAAAAAVLAGLLCSRGGWCMWVSIIHHCQAAEPVAQGAFHVGLKPTHQPGPVAAPCAPAPGRHSCVKQLHVFSVLLQSAKYAHKHCQCPVHKQTEITPNTHKIVKKRPAFKHTSAADCQQPHTYLYVQGCPNV
jgi:hypothetical protein